MDYNNDVRCTSRHYKEIELQATTILEALKEHDVNRGHVVLGAFSQVT